MWDHARQSRIQLVPLSDARIVSSCDGRDSQSRDAGRGRACETDEKTRGAALGGGRSGNVNRTDEQTKRSLRGQANRRKDRGRKNRGGGGEGRPGRVSCGYCDLRRGQVGKNGDEERSTQFLTLPLSETNGKREGQQKSILEKERRRHGRGR